MRLDLSKTDAVILCGGQGKRLRPKIGESQKVMAEFQDAPFLDLLIHYLYSQGFRRIILCTGYKAQEVQEHYRTFSLAQLLLEFSHEEEPLGTGGALKKAYPLIHSNPFFVLNGDCFSLLDYAALMAYHQKQKALLTMAVAVVKQNVDFGQIILDEACRITAFQEKNKTRESCYVNAGVYCLETKKAFSLMPERDKFSLEYDYFPSIVSSGCFGFPIQGEFFDIGTPERFETAKKKLNLSFIHFKARG